MSDDFVWRTEEYRGHRIEIAADPDPVDPREYDHLGTMVSFHSRYNLGDPPASQMRKSRLGIRSDAKHDFTDPEEFTAWLKAQKGIVALPLYLLDHSGLWMRTGPYAEDPGGWDTSLVGFIYATAEALRKEYKVKRITPKIRKKAEALLEAEVKEYSRFLEGGFVGYRVYGPPPEACDKCHHQDEREELESCWGYDDQDYCLKEAKSVVDALCAKEKP